VAAAGGNGATVVATGSLNSPCWSPEGAELAYSATALGRSAIVVLGADMKEVRTVADGPGGKDPLAWTGDGAWFLYTVTKRVGDERTGRWAFSIEIAPADGSGQPRNLTDPTASDYWAVWSAGP
jgi:Tol biopolymer transport system component